MKIIPNLNEVVEFNQFSLAWRWDDLHNPNIEVKELEFIKPFNEVEAKRLNKIIDFYENEENLRIDFTESEWITANSETEEQRENFANIITKLTSPYDENIFLSWNRSTCIYTTLKIFIKYWDDFCYPSSDDLTVLSENTNWIFFYNHIEVGKFWIRK